MLHAALALGDDSPHRSLVHPVVDYVPHAQQPGRQVAVLIPETQPRRRRYRIRPGTERRMRSPRPYWALCDDEENGQGTLGLVTIALVVPACARDCDSGCSGPRRHLTIQVGQVMRHDKSYPPAETNAACSGRLDVP